MGEAGPTAGAVVEKADPEAPQTAHARWPSGRMVGVAGAAGGVGSWKEGGSNSVRIGAPAPIQLWRRKRPAM
jgi:hypothetical protein